MRLAAGIGVTDAGHDICALQIEILFLLLGIAIDLVGIGARACLLNPSIAGTFDAGSDANR